ncbi:restriction endonuclease subunit S [Lactobacillus johnsonii]|uniref:restriction endonuclease subunit S n=1 Tax=Lactobacillus johnsonii TaxID=33959 RepID=UPI001CC12D93|nr:restriction endonuclease subunit S [Lactobacillus johnsonii]
MKDSGIEWIGEIPEEWKIEPVFLHFWQRKAKNFQGREKNLLSLSYGKVIEKDINKLGGLLPASYNTYNIVEPGDIIIRPTDLQNDKKSLRTGLVKEHGIITSAYIDLAPRNKQNVSFFHYMLHAYDIEKVFYNMGNGVRQGLNYEELSKLRLVVPSSEEQKSISNFLDKRVFEINQTSQTIQQEIDALEEYRKSLITETVTKGLDKTVPMKDSGIEWIGEIPENWKIEKAKYSIEINNGSDPIDDDGAVPVYGSGKKSFRTTSDFKVGPAVLLGRKGSISNPLWVENKYWNVDTAFDVKSNGKINLKYYYYCAMCFDYGFYTTQTALPSMTQTEYNNMHIPFPSLQEQSKIVEFLDKKSDRIDKILNQKHQQLTYLDKYKQSIVYEYVTGKKQVSEKEGVKNAQ